MSATHDTDPSTHPTATLLPWYAAGTLAPAERQEVERHLAGCDSCRTELEEIRHLRQAVKGAYAEAPRPVSDVLRRVQQRIKHTSATSTHEELPVVGWFAPLWWRPWLPAALSAVIVAQLFAITWLISTRPSGSEQEAGPVQSRSIPPATVRLHVRFLERATEQEIRLLLNEVHGRITDGPLSGDVYVIEVPVTTGASVEQTIHTLQAKADLVRSAERAQP